MGSEKKSKCFQSVRGQLSASKLPFLTVFLFLLIPAHPFQGESRHWIELVDHIKGSNVNETFLIYSVVKSNRMDLSETSVWAITGTILEESAKYSLDPMLVLAVITVESRFQNAAVSTEGARGLMQIRPFVANALAEEVDLKSWEGEKSLDDPILNIKLGVFYLHYLKRIFRDLKLALTAYNWGPTEVRNRLAEEEVVPLEYAMKVLSTYQSYRKNHRPTDKKP